MVTFGRVLREAGLEVGPGRIQDALCGLDAVGVAHRDDVYWTLRQTLVSRADDIAAFDRAFAAWFLRAPELAPPRTPHSDRPKPAGPPRVTAAEEAAAAGEASDERAAGWSAQEILRRKDFSELTADELAKLRRLIDELAARAPQRRSRRLRRDPHGTTLDMRRLVRASLATGGDPVERAFRDRVETHRKLIVLCDVSGSMEPYSRAILLFVHGAARERPRGRGVRVRDAPDPADRGARRRPTPNGRSRRPSKRVVDWSGGTRIGASLKAFNDLWGRRALSRGAVVVIVSDGWEREDTATVAREMARLARCAYAVVWVNPLKGHPDYEPLAGGMRAALPYVDRFLPGHNLAELEDLAGILARYREEARGMKESSADIERWRGKGEKVASRPSSPRASRLRARGREPRCLRDGQIAGSVSGGCVESDVYECARACSRPASRSSCPMGSRTRRPGRSGFPVAARSTSSSSASKSDRASGGGTQGARRRLQARAGDLRRRRARDRGPAPRLVGRPRREVRNRRAHALPVAEGARRGRRVPRGGRPGLLARLAW